MDVPQRDALPERAVSPRSRRRIASTGGSVPIASASVVYSGMSKEIGSGLRAKVQYVEERGYYEDLLQGTQQWVSEHTCEKVAARLLARLGFTVQ